MARVLVTEKLAERGLELLRQAGHEVDEQLGLSPEELLGVMPGAHALIIRSATQVTDAVLAAGTDLAVVGRAGIGLDNVDVEAATRRGVMVVNAPQSNILSAAEHAVALLLAQARNIPQAHAALAAGKWERSKWEGVELHGKTLGVIGLGRIGALVAQRALAFGMRLCAYDPYVSPDRARQMGVELLPLDELVATADFITIHLPKTSETAGLIGRDLLAKAKPGLRVVNAARGGILDEEALYDALVSGQVAGAALDVFATEPCTDSPLFQLPSVVATPHLGASTAEAQDKAGVTIAEQVILALAGDFVPFAVNVAAAEVSETVRPFLGLAEQLGRCFACLNDGLPERLEVEYAGALAGANTSILTLAVLKGVFAAGTEEPVSYVNAPQLAEERGLEIREASTTATREYVNLITLRAPDHSLAGTLSGPRFESRIVLVDDHVVEVPPAENMLVVRNDDRPGMIGLVGVALGEAGVSISSMAVGPSTTGNTALMVLSTDRAVPDDTFARLRASDGILDIHRITSV
ncbi:MAG TPA: phosphoglycerate dehydrogenase [Acidimicrobiales bacterium]|nr:phosphoglycerate dehydrogenase [Acidimicrobiales bacterium]